MTNDYIVYKHTSPSNRVYIGITNNYQRRSKQHQRASEHGSELAFHRAIRKYGWSKFTHELLAFDLTKQQACDVEVALINVADKGTLYNMTAGGGRVWIVPLIEGLNLLQERLILKVITGIRPKVNIRLS